MTTVPNATANSGQAKRPGKPKRSKTRPIVITVVILLALLVGADFGAAAVAEYQVSKRAKAAFNLSDDPAVTVRGFPFLTQAIGGEYDHITVDSNGYVIAGDAATSANNNCCDLTQIPDPASPNNILAPFWTDLDGTGAEGVRATVLTDGTDDWIVIQHDVNVFGTTDLRSFQVWIGINGTEDIWYQYAPNLADPFGVPFLVGAENKEGQGDMEAVLPTTAGLRVASTDPTPGDVLTYTFKARALSNRSGDVVTEMRASGVPGVTVVRTRLTIP